MSRLKLLGALAGAFAALALSATPALAEWESTQTTGKIKTLAAGSFTFPGNGKFTCLAAEMEAQWQIQGTGQIKQQQKITRKGPHLQIQIKNWGKGCTAEIGTFKFPLTISECDFQLVQQAGVFNATAGVSKQVCVIKMEVLGGNCTIQMPIGMEKSPGSGTGINVGLTNVSLSNVGANQLDKAVINSGGENQKGKGIFAQSSGPGCGTIEPTGEATLEGMEFEAEGVKAI